MTLVTFSWGVRNGRTLEYVSTRFLGSLEVCPIQSSRTLQDAGSNVTVVVLPFAGPRPVFTCGSAIGLHLLDRTQIQTYLSIDSAVSRPPHLRQIRGKHLLPSLCISTGHNLIIACCICSKPSSASLAMIRTTVSWSVDAT